MYGVLEPVDSSFVEKSQNVLKKLKYFPNPFAMDRMRHKVIL